MVIKNTHDGGVDIILGSKLHGHTASVTPLPNGLMELFYAD